MSKADQTEEVLLEVQPVEQNIEKVADAGDVISDDEKKVVSVKDVEKNSEESVKPMGDPEQYMKHPLQNK